MLIVSQEERRASDTVFFTCENNDIANQSVDTSFFTSEKKSYDQSAGFSSAKRLSVYLDAFWRVNLGMYIIIRTPLLNSLSWHNLSVIRTKQKANLMYLLHLF